MEETERLVKAGYGEYRIEVSKKLTQSWSDYFKTWSIAVFVAFALLLIIRMATIYILPRARTSDHNLCLQLFKSDTLSLRVHFHQRRY